MELKSLSASALQTWLACEAMGAYVYIERGHRGEAGDAANLGTAIHKTLEVFVTECHGRFIDPAPQLNRLEDIFDVVIRDSFLAMDAEFFFKEGMPLLRDWYSRQNWHAWSEWEIVSTEARQEFPIATSKGDIPFIYIIDLKKKSKATGDLEVVDYKSGQFQKNHSQLKKDLQALSYATAMWLENPGQSTYWVTMDYLRGVETGVAFRPSECADFYQFLHDVAERIIATPDEEAQEQINPKCRFCPRKHECKTLLSYRHEPLPYLWRKDSLAARRVELANIKAAIDAAMNEVDAAIKGVLEDEDLGGLTSPDGSVVELVHQKRRSVDVDALREVIGPEKLAAMASPGVTQVEALAAAETDPKTRAAIMRTLRQGATTPVLKVTAPDDKAKK